MLLSFVPMFSIRQMTYFIMLAFASLLPAFESKSLADNLFIFGGGDRPKAALQGFIDASGGEDSASILVIQWATSDPVKYFTSLKKDLAVFVNDVEKDVVIAPEDPVQLLHAIRNASGIFFLGGDQEDLMKRLRFYSNELKIDLGQEFRNLFHNGLPIAGTSAGTAVMSRKMIVPTKNVDEPEIKEGIGFLPDYIVVDQHHTARDRVQRLKNAMIKSNLQWGLGVDEDACVHYQDGEFRIFQSENNGRGGTFYRASGFGRSLHFRNVRLTEKPFRIKPHVL